MTPVSFSRASDRKGTPRSPQKTLRKNNAKHLLALLCGDHQGAKGLNRHAQSTARKAVNISLVDTDDLALRVKHGAAAASVGGGCIVNQLVADHVSQVPAGSGRPDQRESG